VYSKADEKALDINSLPLLESKLEIPMFVHVTEADTYRISFKKAHLPEGWSIVLEDRLEGIQVDASQQDQIDALLAASVNKRANRVMIPKIEPTAFEAAETNRFFLVIYPSGTPTNVEENQEPLSFELQQNYPNPFNPSTLIQYSIAESGTVNLVVYDVIGREVAELVNTQQSSGRYQVSFNASGLSSGVYFYQLRSGSSVITKKMMLIK
jgi:hypothetical protein